MTMRHSIRNILNNFNLKINSNKRCRHSSYIQKGNHNILKLTGNENTFTWFYMQQNFVHDTMDYIIMRKHKSSSILVQVNKDHSVESVMNKSKPPQRPQNGCVRTESALSAVEIFSHRHSSAFFLSRRSASIHWTGVDYCWWHASRWRLCCCCFSQIEFAPSWPISILRCKRKRCYYLTSGHFLFINVLLYWQKTYF